MPISLLLSDPAANSPHRISQRQVLLRIGHDGRSHLHRPRRGRRQRRLRLLRVLRREEGIPSHERHGKGHSGQRRLFCGRSHLYKSFFRCRISWLHNAFHDVFCFRRCRLYKRAMRRRTSGTPKIWQSSTRPGCLIPKRSRRFGARRK